MTAALFYYVKTRKNVSFPEKTQHIYYLLNVTSSYFMSSLLKSLFFLAGIASLGHWVPVEPPAAVCAWKGWAVKQADALHLICIQSRG